MELVNSQLLTARNFTTQSSCYTTQSHFRRFTAPAVLASIAVLINAGATLAIEPLGTSQPETVHCDVLVIGGGLSGVGATYEALLEGQDVCLTEITDWVGGQISSQGTSALDETVAQRTRRYFPRGYLHLRDEIIQRTGRSRPGDCWVSEVCFSPQLGHQILFDLLNDAEKQGKGTLHWLPNTVIKDLTRIQSPTSSGELIQSAIAVQSMTSTAASSNTVPLSQIIEDRYQTSDSEYFTKKLLQLEPASPQGWMVIEATETGEILALTDVPYEVGVDEQSYQNPSASSQTPYPFCTQAITYTFAMEATKEPQNPAQPEFFSQYEPFYSFDKQRYADAPELVFSYRRIFSQQEGTGFREVKPGDISMQNWGGGNDYGAGNANDNLILTRQQLQDSRQLSGDWRGGLRSSTLAKAEKLALGYFYWWAQGTTDSKLENANKQPLPNVKLLTGRRSPMGTEHGLSKYPYIRESRRLIGRPDWVYPQGFQINEIDVSRQDYRDSYYQENLSGDRYRSLITARSGLKMLDVITDKTSLSEVKLRERSRLFPDSVGIGHYPIDFHPCMLESPPEKAGNIERPGERQGAAQTYPYQIPLRAMIPQKIDNLIVTGKSIATSHISSATYRVQSFEWSAGAAAGTTAAFSLKQNLYPYQLIETMPKSNAPLRALQKTLNQNGNPTAFPDMSIFNENWKDW